MPQPTETDKELIALNGQAQTHLVAYGEGRPEIIENWPPYSKATGPGLRSLASAGDNGNASYDDD